MAGRSPLYASGVFWTLGYDTIYALQDMEDDALVGVKSSARRLGASAPQAILAFYLASLALLLAMDASQANLAPFFYLFLLPYGAHLCIQAMRVRVDNPQRALALFRSNSWAGLILTFAIAAGTRFLPAASSRCSPRGAVSVESADRTRRGPSFLKDGFRSSRLIGLKSAGTGSCAR